MLEIIANKISDIAKIDKSEASRIEFLRNGEVGGLTPTIQDMDKARHLTEKPIFVMVRPNHLSFVYTTKEKKEMLESIKIAKLTNMDGIVIGAITENGHIDLNFIKEAVSLARPLQVTFHRAFESTNDLVKSAKEIADLGIEYILTSGNVCNPLDGVETLLALDHVLKKTNTKLLIGGGINDQNIDKIKLLTSINNYHAGSFVRIDNSYNNEIDIEKINMLASKKE